MRRPGGLGAAGTSGRLLSLAGMGGAAVIAAITGRLMTLCYDCSAWTKDATACTKHIMRMSLSLA